MTTYINHHPIVRGEDGVNTQDVTHCLDSFTTRRLLWQYGPERTAMITTGQDAATEADLAAWGRLKPRGPDVQA